MFSLIIASKYDHLAEATDLSLKRATFRSETNSSIVKPVVCRWMESEENITGVSTNKYSIENIYFFNAFYTIIDIRILRVSRIYLRNMRKTLMALYKIPSHFIKFNSFEYTFSACCYLYQACSSEY